MAAWIIVLSVIGGLLLIGGIITLVVLAEKKRRRLLAEWAGKQNLRPFDAKATLAWLRDFEAWGPGYGHKAFDGYQGRLGDRPLQVFQHQSRTKTKDSEAVHNFTVCVVETARSAPNLRIKKEHWGHKLVDALGAEDIDFESDEFSRRFWVRCDDRRFAYDVLHPRMMAFFLEMPKANWQWQDQRLVLAVAGSLKPQRATPLIANAEGFLERLPRHLEPS